MDGIIPATSRTKPRDPPWRQKDRGLGDVNTARIRRQLNGARFAAALVAISFLAPAASFAANSKLAAIRIDNFGVINDNYYRGAQPKDEDYRDLAMIGVKTVIDLTKDGRDDEPGLVKGAGM